jgi:hypothetical protein
MGKDGKRPESCEKTTTTNKTNSADCYSGFKHGRYGKRCSRLAHPTKWSYTKCFGPKRNGIRPKSCDLTNNLTEKQEDNNNISDKKIDELATKLCDFFKNDDSLSIEKYIDHIKPQITDLNLTPNDDIKLLIATNNKCFEKNKLTMDEVNTLSTQSSYNSDEIQEKLQKAVEAGEFITKFINNEDDIAGKIAYDFLLDEPQTTDKGKKILNILGEMLMKLRQGKQEVDQKPVQQTFESKGGGDLDNGRNGRWNNRVDESSGERGTYGGGREVTGDSRFVEDWGRSRRDSGMEHNVPVSNQSRFNHTFYNDDDWTS